MYIVGFVMTDQVRYILTDEVQSISGLIARFISAGFSDIEH